MYYISTHRHRVKYNNVPQERKGKKTRLQTSKYESKYNIKCIESSLETHVKTHFFILHPRGLLHSFGIDSIIFSKKFQKGAFDL